MGISTPNAAVSRIVMTTSQRRRRLLLILNDAAFYLSHFRHLGRSARAAGYELYIALPYDAALWTQIKAECDGLRPLPLRRGGRNPVSEFRLLWETSKLIRELRPDIVHALTMKPVIWGGIAARIAGAPALLASITGLGYAFTSNDVMARILRMVIAPLYRIALSHPNAIALFENPDDEALFLTRGLARSDRTARVNGAGVDPAEFFFAPEPADAQDNPVILFPARLLRDKGLVELIEAVRILKARGWRLRLRLAGRLDRENPSAIDEDMVRAWEREGLAEWAGFLRDMPMALRAATIVCLPSWREGLPRALIEAAAVGRAIVTTDAPGCRAIVRHEETGLLIPVRDAAALANALERLLRAPQLRDQLRHAGRALIETEFSAARIADDILALYARIGARP